MKLNCNINKHCLPANMERADEMIKSLLNREGDIIGFNYIKYVSVVREVFMDLNLDIIRLTKRMILPVDKNTMTVELPEETLMLSSVAAVDRQGRWRHMHHNGKITGDIVDLSLSKGCGCECGCGGSICSGIKSYEPIVEPVEIQMPDDSLQTFEIITRKRVDTDGKMLIEKTFPIQVYDGSVYTGVKMITETEVLCNLELSKCGCVKECASNQAAVDACCNASSWQDECGTCKPTCELEYGVTVDGNRLVLPAKLNVDRVGVRIYVSPKKLTDIWIPTIARKAFMLGLKDAINLFSEDVTQNFANRIAGNYEREKDKLFDRLTRWNVKDIEQVLTPHIIFP